VSADQLHAPASLHLGNGLRYRLNRKLCGPKKRFGDSGKQSRESNSGFPNPEPNLSTDYTLQMRDYYSRFWGWFCVCWMQIAQESVFFYTYTSEVR
jgi:hypothetical protein